MLAPDFPELARALRAATSWPETTPARALMAKFSSHHLELYGPQPWMGLHIFWNEADGRLLVSGLYPQDEAGGSFPRDRRHVPTIALGAHRPVTALAKEIARRFLPAYLQQFELGRREHADYRRGADRIHALCQELCTAGRKLGFTPVASNAGVFKGRLRSGGMVHGNNAKHEVDLTLTWLPAEVALKVVQYLDTLLPEKTDHGEQEAHHTENVRGRG